MYIDNRYLNLNLSWSIHISSRNNYIFVFVRTVEVLLMNNL